MFRNFFLCTQSTTLRSPRKTAKAKPPEDDDGGESSRVCRVSRFAQHSHLLQRLRFAVPTSRHLTLRVSEEKRIQRRTEMRHGHTASCRSGSGLVTLGRPFPTPLATTVTLPHSGTEFLGCVYGFYSTPAHTWVPGIPRVVHFSHCVHHPVSCAAWLNGARSPSTTEAWKNLCHCSGGESPS